MLSAWSMRKGMFQRRVFKHSCLLPCTVPKPMLDADYYLPQVSRRRNESRTTDPKSATLGRHHQGHLHSRTAPPNISISIPTDVSTSGRPPIRWMIANCLLVNRERDCFVHAYIVIPVLHHVGYIDQGALKLNRFYYIGIVLYCMLAIRLRHFHTRARNIDRGRVCTRWRWALVGR